MADFTDASDSTSGPSFTSLMNKLPKKRLDAKFAAAAQASLPQQGEQTGGHRTSYGHLSHVPLFPLYSEKQTKIIAQTQAHKDRKVRAMDQADPDKNLTGAQKGVLGVMAHLSGGANPVSVKRWERRLIGTNVDAANRSMEQKICARFTRWTVPSSAGTFWFVDVLEYWHINPDSKIARLAGNCTSVSLKAGLVKDGKAALKLLGLDATGLKSQKTWSKRVKSEWCDAIVAVGEDGREVEMEIVARIQRACSAPEANELQRRFDKEWNVPIT